MTTPRAAEVWPLPLRTALVGALVLGAVGAVVGLVVGWAVHPPTAWAATVEVGLPALVLGALLGLVAGGLRVALARARPRRPDHQPPRPAPR